MNVHEHLTGDDLRRFRRGAMSPPETREAARHLAACDECAGRGAEAAAPVAGDGWLAQAVAGEAEHPESETMVAFVAGALDAEPRRALERHLRRCAMCRREVAELRADVEADPSLRKQRSPAFRLMLAVAASAAVVVTALYVLQRRPAAPPAGPISHTSGAAPRSAAESALVSEALTRGVQPPPFLEELRPRADVPRNALPYADGAAVSMTPAGIVAESERPQFAWSAAGHSYVVTVLDGAHIVERSGPLDAPHWTPPQPLPRGRTYEWQVEVRDSVSDSTMRVIPSPPAPPAFFRVADAASMQAIEETRRVRPGDHLLLGVLYARAGLQRQAEAELSQYSAQHPADARARRLLDSILRW